MADTTPTFDIVVYGATAGGVMAAIAAANQGARVTIIEPGRHVGGMVSGGLGHTDYGERAILGGLALEFYERVAQYYGAKTWGIVGPEPHIAEQILHDWLRDAGVSVVYDRRLERLAMDGRRIAQLITQHGEAYSARIFIDASYEGDLLPAAGIAYAVGREGTASYGESWAGRRPLLPGQHNFNVAVSPFVDSSDGELLPLMHRRPMAREGESDSGIQAFCFRLCLTDRPQNRVPFPRPDDYDAGDYELLRRYIRASGISTAAGKLMSLVPNLPNHKCDVNSIGPISTNLLDGSSWAYPEAGYAARQAIRQRHLRYTQGLLYFLANDSAVPAPIRRELSDWGLCRDEFVDTGHWPHQLYVREARRMRGEYWLTQADLEQGRSQYDAIGMGSYNIDIREVQRVWVPVSRGHRIVGETFNEGYVSVPVPPYQIPYRSLLPRYTECDNLLVPICVSASHVAFASLRMEPQYMIMGHAAGVAAAMAAQHSLAVQHVDLLDLQRRLIAQRQVLAYNGE